MPRATKTKSRLHTSAVSLPSKLKTASVVQQEAPSIPKSADFASSIYDEPSTSRSQQQKKAEFIAAVQSAPHPYMIKSKSHLKREKRKLKNQNASTNLSSIENALESILPPPAIDEERNEGTVGAASKSKIQSKVDKEEERRKRLEKMKEQGKISEGRGKTLGEKKRRDVIQEASKRIPAVLSHPAYKSDPWAAIREHVGNTIATKAPPVKK